MVKVKDAVFKVANPPLTIPLYSLLIEHPFRPAARLALFSITMDDNHGYERDWEDLSPAVDEYENAPVDGFYSNARYDHVDIHPNSGIHMQLNYAHNPNFFDGGVGSFAPAMIPMQPPFAPGKLFRSAPSSAQLGADGSI
jgi:hypothetical protein